MGLKTAIKQAINQNTTKVSAIKVEGIDKSSSLYQDMYDVETWFIEVTVRKLKRKRVLKK